MNIIDYEIQPSDAANAEVAEVTNLAEIIAALALDTADGYCEF